MRAAWRTGFARLSLPVCFCFQSQQCAPGSSHSSALLAPVTRVPRPICPCARLLACAYAHIRDHTWQIALFLLLRYPSRNPSLYLSLFLASTCPCICPYTLSAPGSLSCHRLHQLPLGLTILSGSRCRKEGVLLAASRRWTGGGGRRRSNECLVHGREKVCLCLWLRGLPLL